MASSAFLSFFDDAFRGKINCDVDKFKVLLLTAAYKPNKNTQTKRSHLSNEVAAGAGYVPGGFEAKVLLRKNTDKNRLDLLLGGIAIPNATITAAYAVYYKWHSGLSTFDELVVVNDLGGNIASTNGMWTLAESELTIQPEDFKR